MGRGLLITCKNVHQYRNQIAQNMDRVAHLYDCALETQLNIIHTFKNRQTTQPKIHVYISVVQKLYRLFHKVAQP